MIEITETIEEFLARGGEIAMCEPQEVKAKQKAKPTQKNIDYRYYDYSNADCPSPLNFERGGQ